MKTQIMISKIQVVEKKVQHKSNVLIKQFLTWITNVALIAIMIAILPLLAHATVVEKSGNVSGETWSAGTELAKTIIGHFTYLIGIIVVFYFGSSAVRDYLKDKKAK